MKLKKRQSSVLNKAWLAIFSAGALWGTIGLYVGALRALGFSSLEIVTLRAWSTVFWLFFFIVLIQRRRPVVPRWSWPYFLGTGLLSMALFNWAYFQAMHLLTLSVAAALLYTGPAFVVLLARFFFKEPLSRIKWIAIGLTSMGAALASGINGTVLKDAIFTSSTEGDQVMFGLFIGLLSGFAYGLYSIFAKPLTRRLDTVVIVFYTFVVTAVILTPFTHIWEKFDYLFNGFDLRALLLVLGLGLFPTALAYILYTYGLNRESAGRAALLTSIEPVVAVLIGALVFHDHLSIGQWAGIVAIIGAVLLLGQEA